MNDRKTNIEFITDLMDFSNFGPLAQMFVIQALTVYSAKVAQADPDKMDNALVSGAAWVGVAKEIKAKLDSHYGLVPSSEFAEEHSGEAD